MVIVGCGAAGLQTALYAEKYNLTYAVLERSAHCGAFFDGYPRGQHLISFNKPNIPKALPGWSKENHDDYALRFDWHSMQATDEAWPRFTTRTDLFTPPAQEFVSYLEDTAQHHRLRVRYRSEVVRVGARSSDGIREVHFIVGDNEMRESLLARYVILATGLEERVAGPDLEVNYTYGTAPMDCDTYRGRHVFVVGNGNSGMEMASYVIQNCAAMRVWVLGHRPVQPSHHTHYVGNVRNTNLLPFESYLLKNLDVLIDDGAVSEDWAAADFIRKTVAEGESDLSHVVIFAGGFRAATMNVSGAPVPRSQRGSRYFDIGAFNELAGRPGIFAVGANAHSRDYHESAGGFVHGFRYTAKTVVQYLAAGGVASWPYLAFENRSEANESALDRVWDHVVLRLQSSSTLWHLEGFYGDMIVDVTHVCTAKRARAHPSPTFLYVEQIPLRDEMDRIAEAVVADYCGGPAALGKRTKPRRAVVLFSYAESFHGCEASFSENRNGAGFISPTVMLEQNPATTPPARVREDPRGFRDWSGWSVVRAQEDLLARWNPASSFPMHLKRRALQLVEEPLRDFLSRDRVQEPENDADWIHRIASMQEAPTPTHVANILGQLGDVAASTDGLVMSLLPPVLPAVARSATVVSGASMFPGTFSSEHTSKVDFLGAPSASSLQSLSGCAVEKVQGVGKDTFLRAGTAESGASSYYLSVGLRNTSRVGLALRESIRNAAALVCKGGTHHGCTEDMIGVHVKGAHQRTHFVKRSGGYFVLQVAGSQRLTLVGPNENHALLHYPPRHPLGGLSQISAQEIWSDVAGDDARESWWNLWTNARSSTVPRSLARDRLLSIVRDKSRNVTLRAGDGLFVPRGWSVSEETSSIGPSIHFSIRPSSSATEDNDEDSVVSRILKEVDYFRLRAKRFFESTTTGVRFDAAIRVELLYQLAKTLNFNASFVEDLSRRYALNVPAQEFVSSRRRTSSWLDASRVLRESDAATIHADGQILADSIAHRYFRSNEKDIGEQKSLYQRVADQVILRLHERRRLGGSNGPMAARSFLTSISQKLLRDNTYDTSFVGDGAIWDTSSPSELTYFVVQLDHADESAKVLVVDLPENDPIFHRTMHTAQHATYDHGGASSSSFPGMKSMLPNKDMYWYGEYVTQQVGDLVKDVFDEDIAVQDVRGFFQLVCRHPDAPLLHRSQYNPHVDAPDPSTIVAVHYLGDRETWPHGGGTGLFRDSMTGNTQVNEASCYEIVRRGAANDSSAQYERLCGKYFGDQNKASRQQPKQHDETKGFLGEIPGDYGDFELIYQATYKPNRIVLYRATQLHSGIITKDGAMNLSCDPHSRVRRAAASLFWMRDG
eukprot:g2766.t1